MRCCLAAAAATGPLAVWVVANLHYSRVLKQIAPLEGQLNKLKGELTESQHRLKQCQEELMALDEQVHPQRILC
jgi:chromosome segregation ATPase